METYSICAANTTSYSQKEKKSPVLCILFALEFIFHVWESIIWVLEIEIYEQNKKIYITDRSKMNGK